MRTSEPAAPRAGVGTPGYASARAVLYPVGMEPGPRRRRRGSHHLVAAFLRDPGSGRVYKRGKLIGKVGARGRAVRGSSTVGSVERDAQRARSCRGGNWGWEPSCHAAAFASGALCVYQVPRSRCAPCTLPVSGVVALVHACPLSCLLLSAGRLQPLLQAHGHVHQHRVRPQGGAPPQ